MKTFEPADIGECVESLARAARERLRIGIVGGGTALELGNPGQPLDALLQTRRLNHVVEYAPEDQVIVAEAGVTLAELQSLAGKNGQWLGVDAPHAERATLGGLVAVGAFGPRRARYGGIRELLLGITLVRADGVVAKSGSKVVKNVAGFDLPKVVCGSLGTLGLIAQVSLRLHPLPEASATVQLDALTAAQVVDTRATLLCAQLEPSSLVALYGLAGRYDLGVRFEGFQSGVTRDVDRLLSLLAPGVRHERLDTTSAAEFWQRHELARSVGELRARINALPTQLAPVDAALGPLLGALQSPQFVWYAGLGLGFVSGKPVNAEPAVLGLNGARSGVVRLGGSLVVDAAPAEVRTKVDAWGPLPSAFPIMQELKQRFDPERRLNPGRFIGGL